MFDFFINVFFFFFFFLFIYFFFLVKIVFGYIKK